MIRQFEKKDNLYIIRFQGATFKQDVTLMHSLEGARFVSADKHWVANASDWNKGTLIRNGFKDATPKEVVIAPFIPPKITYNVVIDKNKLSPNLFKYQIEGVIETEKHNGNLMILDEMGCISGNAVVSLNRASLTRKYTLRQAYLKLHGANPNDLNIPTYIRGLKHTGQFGLLLVTDIVYRGTKETYKLITDSGKTIIATPDHQFMIPGNTWKELKDFVVGDDILVNGRLQCPICGTTEDICHTKQGKYYGYCHKCMYEKRNLPRKILGSRACISKHDGYVYLRGDTYRSHSRYSSSGLLEHIWIMEQAIGRPLAPGEEVHHINGVRHDNRIENLMLLSRQEHAKIHRMESHFTNFVHHASGKEVIMVPKIETVVQIEFYGMDEVYDVLVENEEHNFIADGFIVHNCGKSNQAISYCKLHPEYKILVICPGFIKINWQREIKRWGDESSTILSGMTPYQFDTINRFVIINYDLLSAWKIELLKHKFDVVIGDEIQYVSNNKAHRTKAFIEIVKRIPKKLFLSGTPFKNKPSEFFTALNLISPENFPNRWKFLNRYCNPKHTGYGWTFNGATNIDELVERTKPFYIRRTKSEVLPELPQKQINVVSFDMSHSLQLKYDSASETFQEWATSANKKYAEGKAHAETLRTIAYLGKREYALQWIQDFLETNKKLVVFVYHREAIKDVVGALGKLCVSIDGSTSNEERQRAVDEFQNNDKIRVLVGQIQAAGVGITLTAASDAVFLEFPWTPADALQAGDRVHRLGQKADKVTIWYMVTEKTIDEDMMAMIQEKHKVLDRILDNGTADPFFGEDVLTLMRRKYENN